MTGSIVFSGLEWLLPAAAVLIALALALVWSGHRGAVERRIRIGCGLLKFTGILALVLCLLEPLWVTQRARPGANTFAIIADNSRGLQVKDAFATESRADILRQRLTSKTRDWQTALEENFQVRRYTFDSRLQHTRDFSELDFEGGASALGNALRTASEHWRGQPVAGALLFTDGNATDIAGELPTLEDCPPIYPVVLGEEDDIPDLSLVRASVSQTAFEDAPVTIQAQVTADGFSGSDLVARVTRIATGTTIVGTNAAASAYQITTATNVVAQAVQRAGAGDAEVNFRFQIQPDGPGIHFYELETRLRNELDQPAADSREATLVNNRQVIVVDRGQEPLRVLYVSGRPNWEYKFLNRAIQDDPQVQLVALIRAAAREPKFEFKSRAGESSNPLFRGFGGNEEDKARYDQPVLIRLNTRDALELRGGFPKTAEELFAYHAVIFDDLEAEFFTRDQLALLQRFVAERGGGFLMLGGAESFHEGNYAGTPIASLLPVYVDRPVQTRPFDPLRLTLTREGWLQPWTRLRATESEEKARLGLMPGFNVINPVREIKPGASVLATVLDADDTAHPALVVQRFGLGRTAALMIGDMWQWGLRDEGTQTDLAKSWRQLVRWLVADVPSRITVAAHKAESGDPSEMRLTVKAFDEEFKPLDNAAVQLVVRPVRIASAGTDAVQTNSHAGNFVRLTADASASQPATYEATFMARETGAYSVEAVVTASEGKVVGRAAAGWTSDPAADEFRSLKPNRALLETIAKRTGGEIIAARDLEKFALQLPLRSAPITETSTSPLWHKPFVFLFVLGCFVTEWGVRRWKGLP